MKLRFMTNLIRKLSNKTPVAALGGALALAGSALAFTQNPKAEHFSPPPVDESPLPRDVAGHSSFAPVVKKVAPAVVKVFTTTKLHNTAYNGAPEGGMDDMLRRFFGDQLPGGRGQRREFGMPRQQGIGSGVIATKD